MIDVTPLTDSTPLLGDPKALHQRFLDEGVVFLRGVMDPELMAWGREKYRDALAAEGLIDPAVEAPVWTGKKTDSWRPCDVIGTTFWHEVVKQPRLNAIMRDLFAEEAVWIPIAAHRSGLPSGPVKEGQDLFSGRHQDGFSNEGMLFTICWMPVRDVDMDRGSFAVAPGTHKRGILHDQTLDGSASTIPAGRIPDDAWRSADFRVGDVLIFNYLTAHTALPNPSDEIRMSLDVRAIPASAPQPVIGAVEGLTKHGDSADVTIRTENEGAVTVHVTGQTLIRDMNPWPRVPLAEVEKIAYPGAHVMAMARPDRSVTVLRRNFY